MIDIEWIFERKQHSIFRRLTDVVDDPRVIVETLRILWGGGAIRAVLIFCDQPWFYNLTLPRQRRLPLRASSRFLSSPPSSSLLFSVVSIHLLRIFPGTREDSIVFHSREINL